MRSVALCLVVFLQVHSMNCAKIISVQNGGQKGDWGITKVCYSRTLATGFRLKVEGKHGWYADDSSLNGITLYCTKNSTQNVLKEITSSVGDFGSWRRNFFCASGFLVSFCLRVDHNSHDNTAANNIRFRCSNSDLLEGDGLDWGNYGACSNSCPWGICGIRTRVQEKQTFFYDDSALNDVQFLCCSSNPLQAD